jgi:tetratricopeptide (TPR) repeat protein
LADETLLALAGWLNKIGRPAKTLEVLPQARAIQRQDLFLQYINALVALQRWNEVKDLFLSEHSVVDPMVQHMYLAVAQARLGSATGATNEWQRALQVANTLEKLLTLATNAEQNSVSDIADAAYSEAIKTAPTTNRTAYAGRLRLALAAGRDGSRKRSPPKSFRCGPMTRQRAFRTRICDCCSALQVMQPKQRSATLRCSSRKSQGTGKPEQRSASPVFVWAGTKRRWRHFKACESAALSRRARSLCAQPLWQQTAFRTAPAMTRSCS